MSKPDDGNNKTYTVLSTNFPEIFPPLKKVVSINNIENSPWPRPPQETFSKTIHPGGSTTLKEVCLAILKEGATHMTVSYTKPGEAIKDEYKDEDGDWVYGTIGHTEEDISVTYSYRNPNFLEEQRKYDGFMNQIKHAQSVNPKLREQNREAMEYNKERVHVAKVYHSEYWKAACKAHSTNDLSSLKDLVRAKLQARLDALDAPG